MQYMQKNQGFTWSKTNTPPRRKAIAFAPFLMKTPAQIPHTLPNVRSYMLTIDCGGGGCPCGVAGEETGRLFAGAVSDNY
jgi:hypothetical protein